MFNDILIPGLSLGIIGLVLGAVLAVASVIFKVEEDERIPAITEALPGANCGGCGFAGCSAYATAIVNDGKPNNLCPVGGANVVSEIAKIMGIEAGEFVPQKPVVMCGGTCFVATNKYEYRGISDCAAAMRVSGGPKDCSYGCLGFGTCVNVCEQGAISIQDGVAVINPDKCIACNACVNICPKKVIVSKPIKNNVYVKCKSEDKGPKVRKYCTVGCIGCMMCEKACEFDAIKVKNFVAEIDYSKCTNCGACVKTCPSKCIIQ